MMRIAILNPWGSDAESEITKRFIRAGNKIGYIIQEVKNADDINLFIPDFVISITRETPKTTSYPTYHVANLPINHYFEFEDAFTQNNKKAIKNIKTLLTYDAYLTNSKIVGNWLEDVCFGANKDAIVFDSYYSSFYNLDYKEVNLVNPRLAYFGVNWDGPRFGNLFATLSSNYDFMSFYGPKNQWEKLSNPYYQGEVVFDGISIIEKYRECGVGLCLHRPEFIADNMPTNRIFEITASSAIAIASKMDFIEKNYGDSVLYVDQSGSEKEVIDQIAVHMEWIKNNPEKALEKAKKANEIFNKNFSLEVLLKNLSSFHKKVLKTKYYSEPYVASLLTEEPLVEILIIVDKNFCEEKIKKTVLSIRNQSYRNFKINFLCKKNFNRERGSLTKVFSPTLIDDQIKIEITDFSNAENLLKTINGSFFAILDEKSVLYPNHLSMLLSKIPSTEGGGNSLVYSGCVDYNEKSIYSEENRNKISEKNDDYDLVFFKTSDHTRLPNFGLYNESDIANANVIIRPAALIADSRLLTKRVVDKLIKENNLSHLAPIIMQDAKIIFCCEVTCQYTMQKTLPEMMETGLLNSRAQWLNSKSDYYSWLKQDYQNNYDVITIISKATEEYHSELRKLEEKIPQYIDKVFSSESSQLVSKLVKKNQKQKKIKRLLRNIVKMRFKNL